MEHDVRKWSRFERLEFCLIIYVLARAEKMAISHTPSMTVGKVLVVIRADGC